jgi:hypothetical protein
MLKQAKQASSFVSKPCFTCFMTLLQSLSLSCYTSRFDMFQGMEHTCCIYMLHKPHFVIKKLCCILMFQAKQMHKWDEWCSCLWNASANVEAKHLGCYSHHHCRHLGRLGETVMVMRYSTPASACRRQYLPCSIALACREPSQGSCLHLHWESQVRLRCGDRPFTPLPPRHTEAGRACHGT